MSDQHRIALFNSSLEAGVRSLAILVAAYPESYDLQRVVEMDYLVVHSGDVGGPDSLHAPLPLRAGELLVRQGLIEKGLLLMLSRGLVSRVQDESGFIYIAAEPAAPFISSLTAIYSRRLVVCAQWAVDHFAEISTEEVRKITHRFFERWGSQLAAGQQPGGSS